MSRREAEASREVDPRVTALRAAVTELRARLDAHPAVLRDRGTAEEGLDALAALADAGVPRVSDLRQALLLTAAALGSVSALAVAFAEVRNAAELFGEPARVAEPGPA